MTRYSAAAFSACLLFPLAGLADEVNVMPSIHYDYIAAKLVMDGYRDLRVVDADLGTVSAYDHDGSEVIIHVDELSHKVLSSNYVHISDQ